MNKTKRKRGPGVDEYPRSVKIEHVSYKNNVLQALSTGTNIQKYRAPRIQRSRQRGEQSTKLDTTDPLVYPYGSHSDKRQYKKRPLSVIIERR